MIVFLCCTSIVLSILLTISVKKNIESYEKLEALSVQVEESLDLLDECHQKIDTKTKINVMFDDPVVKDLLQDIGDCKNSVLLVANKLYSPFQNEEN